VTTFVEDGKAGVRCDTEGCDAVNTVSNTNIMRAQRVAINFFGWRVYKENDLWRHACPKHVDEWKAKQ
jgi:hypothetical protein